MWKLGAGAALAMTTMLGGAASAQNLLVNGDFEMAEDFFGGSTFPGWDCTGFCISNDDISSDDAYSGSFSGGFINELEFSELIQSVTTVIGATYRFSVALRIDFSDVSAVGYGLGSGPLVELPQSTTWAEFSQDFIATGTTTEIRLFLEECCGISIALFDAVSFVLIALPGTTTEEELSALLAAAGGAARLVVLDAQGVARDLGQASIVARGDQLTLELVEATDGDEVVISSKSETPGLVGNLYTWAQITGFDSEADDGPASINGTGFQIGADMAVGTDMVAGLSLGYSDINASDEGFSQDGTLTYLQPYLAYRSGAWQGNASLIFGQGDYDQTSEGGDGSGETELFAFTFEGGYDMALQNGLTVTPMVGLISGSEDVTGISGTLANAGTESYDFTQASLGARLTSRKLAGMYFAGLHADYLDQDAGSTVLASEFLSENGWSGRVEVGGATQLEGGFGLSTSFDISGIGGSAQTLSGGLRVALQF